MPWIERHSPGRENPRPRRWCPPRVRQYLCLASAILTLSICARDSAAEPVTAPMSVAAVAVLEFELRDLTLDPNNPAQQQQTASLKPLLEQALAARHFRIVPVDAATQAAADKGAGYLFDHPDMAAALGRTVGADWVVVGRVHKASFLFVYFKAHLVHVQSQQQRADLVVEVKGPQQRLTERGIESLAKQIAAAMTP